MWIFCLQEEKWIYILLKQLDCRGRRGQNIYLFSSFEDKPVEEKSSQNGKAAHRGLFGSDYEKLRRSYTENTDYLKSLETATDINNISAGCRMLLTFMTMARCVFTIIHYNFNGCWPTLSITWSTTWSPPSWTTSWPPAEWRTWSVQLRW